jgi:hypothetical protein
MDSIRPYLKDLKAAAEFGFYGPGMYALTLCLFHETKLFSPLLALGTWFMAAAFKLRYDYRERLAMTETLTIGAVALVGVILARASGSYDGTFYCFMVAGSFIGRLWDVWRAHHPSRAVTLAPVAQPSKPKLRSVRSWFFE